MEQPTTAYLVSKGIYADRRAIAVFAQREGEHGAQAFCDHSNITNPGAFSGDGYDVEEIDFYGPGVWTKPPTPAVIEGDFYDEWEPAHELRD